jgi:hypothetical protein
MTQNTRLVPASKLSPNLKIREATIKYILAKGKVVRFTNTINGVTKDVNTWNADDDGDLTAFRHTGNAPYVCWSASQYTISEIDK